MPNVLEKNAGIRLSNFSDRRALVRQETLGSGLCTARLALKALKSITHTDWCFAQINRDPRLFLATVLPDAQWQGTSGVAAPGKTFMSNWIQKNHQNHDAIGVRMANGGVDLVHGGPTLKIGAGAARTIRGSGYEVIGTLCGPHRNTMVFGGLYDNHTRGWEGRAQAMLGINAMNPQGILGSWLNSQITTNSEVDLFMNLAILGMQHFNNRAVSIAMGNNTLVAHLEETWVASKLSGITPDTCYALYLSNCTMPWILEAGRAEIAGIARQPTGNLAPNPGWNPLSARPT